MHSQDRHTTPDAVTPPAGVRAALARRADGPATPDERLAARAPTSLPAAAHGRATPAGSGAPFAPPMGARPADRGPAPLNGSPLPRAWLAERAVRLDPRRHPTVSGAAAVTALLRRTEAGRGAVRAPVLWGASDTQPAAARTASPAATAPRSAAAELLNPGRGEVRTASLFGTLSAALDIGEGRARGHAVRAAYLALRMATEAGLADFERADLLYTALLKDAGTSGGAGRSTDGAGRTRTSLFARAAAPSASLPHLVRSERAAVVVHAFGFPDEIGRAVQAVRERWDGRGTPEGLRKESIPLFSRIVAIAEAAELVAARSGTGAAERHLKSRRRTEFDPTLVRLFLALAKHGLWRDLAAPDLEDRLLALEPVHLVRRSDPAGLDALAATFADIVDTRTPQMGPHGSTVAALAVSTARAIGLADADVRELRRASLLHDIGKLAIPIAYLEKPERLSSRELATVAAHPRHSYQVLSAAPALRGIAELAACHHDPLDGKGRFTSVQPGVASVSARILAVCDRFEAMTAERPYRRPLSADEALVQLRQVAEEPLARDALAALEATL